MKSKSRNLRNVLRNIIATILTIVLAILLIIPLLCAIVSFGILFISYKILRRLWKDKIIEVFKEFFDEYDEATLLFEIGDEV